MAGWNSTSFNDRDNTITSEAVDFRSHLPAEFHISYALIGTGIAGTSANALVLYALVVDHLQDSKKRSDNFLIISQNSLDLCCCLSVAICRSVEVSNIYLTGFSGYMLCTIFVTDNAVYYVINGSLVNLMALTVERYLKVVFPFWSKKNLKRWMIYAAIAFSWIAEILSVAPVAFVTSIVYRDCFAYHLLWQNRELETIYCIWNLISFFLAPLVIFVYCYGHIVVVIRKQTRVMAGHHVVGSAKRASQAQSKRVKWNVIKTMIIDNALFVCWFPVNVYDLLARTIRRRTRSGTQWPLATMSLCVCRMSTSR